MHATNDVTTSSVFEALTPYTGERTQNTAGNQDGKRKLGKKREIRDEKRE